MRRVRCLLVPLSLFATGGVASAQGSRRILARCEGRLISAIDITPRDPSFLAIPRPLRAIVRGAGVHHTTTRADVIGRFLLLEVGKACTERKRSESERILRLQPFLADATVDVVPDSAGGVRIAVETVDEIPTVFVMHIRDRRPSSIRLGNSNAGGQGLYLAGSVERGFAYRTGVGVYGVAHQAFGRPYTLTLEAERKPLGSALTVALGHTFFTDLQRTAWHVGYSNVNRYASFVRPDSDALSLGVRRRFWDVGGVRRVGIGRRSAFVGALVTHEEATPEGRFVVITDSGLVADTGAALHVGAPAYRNLRVNAVLGMRALSFVTVRGFDALAGVQDVATGVQFGTLAGRGIRRFGASDDDLLVSSDVYAGLGSARSFTAIRFEGEAREDRRTGRWDSMVASGRLAWYVKPAEAHVFVSSVEYAGVWRERVPFQLTLGDRRSGVRGYGASRVAGSARTVARVEERWRIGALTRRSALGLATFVDAGRVQAGHAPFGIDSRTKIGVGVGLLAAIPAQSQRLWRLDLALPVSPDAHARLELRLTSVWTRAFWREPSDIGRARAGAAPSTIFTWP
jgi:hypothetical protein